MSLVRFDLNEDIADLRREVNRMFAGSSLLTQPMFTAADRWLPAMDTIETDGKLCVTLDLPGMDRKDVDVEVEGDILTIKGSRKIEREEADRRWYRYERSSGNFERALQLPEEIDPNTVSAKFDRGVLKVDVPLPGRVVAAPKRIEIEAGS